MSELTDYDEEREYDPFTDPDWCDECQGTGRVVTADFESYLGANYKPCPRCEGDPCHDQPPIS